MKETSCNLPSPSAQHSTEHGSISLCHGEVIHLHRMLLAVMLERVDHQCLVALASVLSCLSVSHKSAEKINQSLDRNHESPHLRGVMDWFGSRMLMNSEKSQLHYVALSLSFDKVNSWLTHA